jgi:ribonuclease HI
VGEPPLPRLISVPEGYTTAATDGSCIKSGNDGWGPGGWAYVTEDGRKESKAARRSTNNRMELLAVYYLLKSHPYESFLILSDSEYVIGVLTGQNKVKANEDIVRRITELMTAGRSVRFKKVVAHSKELGHPLNVEADRLAQIAARRAARRTV